VSTGVNLYQPAEKDPYASLRSIVSLQRTRVSTPPLVDFSRASPLSLFEQAARRVLSSLLEGMPALGIDLFFKSVVHWALFNQSDYVRR